MHPPLLDLPFIPDVVKLRAENHHRSGMEEDTERRTPRGYCGKDGETETIDVRGDSEERREALLS